MNVEKHTMRQDYRRRRRALAAQSVTRAGVAVHAQLQAFAPYQAAASVIAYLEHENEIPTAALIDDAVRTQRRVYLPRQADGAALVLWHPGQPLEVGPGGVRQPEDSAPEDPVPPAAILLPLVGWDVRGTRLGRGSGFYDRLCATLSPVTLRIGLGYEFQEHPGLPREPWDVPLHYVVTERRLVCCDAAGWSASFQKGGLQL